MYQILELEWPNDFEIIMSMKPLVCKHISGACIDKRGLINKISTLDANPEFRKWAEKLVVQSGISKWGERIPKFEELSDNAEILSKKYGTLEILIKNSKKKGRPIEYIVILVFLKKKFKAQELLQQFISAYREIKSIELSVLINFRRDIAI